MKHFDTETLVARTGLKNRQHLLRLREYGLIPDPTRLPNPNGSGRVAVYPAKIESRIRAILQMRADGDSYKKIREVLGPMEVPAGQEASEREPEADPYFDSPHFRKGDTLNVFIHCYGVLKKDGPESARPEVSEGLINRAMAEGAQLLKNGFEPVLLWDGKTHLLMSDIAMGMHFAQNGPPAGPVEVQYLRPIFTEAYRRLGYPFDIKPTVRPSNVVFVREDDGWREANSFVDPDGALQVVRRRSPEEINQEQRGDDSAKGEP